MIDYRRIGQAFKLGVVFSRGCRLVNDERWITYHPNGKENKGRRMLIDEDGNVLKGGGPFGGMNLKDIPKKAAEIKQQRAQAKAAKAGGATGAAPKTPAAGTKATAASGEVKVHHPQWPKSHASQPGIEELNSAPKTLKTDGKGLKYVPRDLVLARQLVGNSGLGEEGEARRASIARANEQAGDLDYEATYSKRLDELRKDFGATASEDDLKKAAGLYAKSKFYDTLGGAIEGQSDAIKPAYYRRQANSAFQEEQALYKKLADSKNGSGSASQTAPAAAATYNLRESNSTRSHEMAAQNRQTASESGGKPTEALRSDLEKLRTEYGSIKPMDYERTRAASAKNLGDLESAVSRVKELAQKADMYDVTKVMDVQNDFKKLEERLSHPLQNDPMAKRYGLENSVFSDDQKQVIRNYFFNKYRDRLAQAEQYLDASGRMKDIQNKALETAQAIRESNGGPSKEGASFAEEFGPMNLSDDYRKWTRTYLNGTTTPDELLADVGGEARWRAKSHINETIKKATGQAMKNDWLTFKIDNHEWFFDRGTGRWLEPDEAKSKRAQQSLERARRDAAKKGYADKAVFSFKGKTGSFDWN